MNDARASLARLLGNLELLAMDGAHASSLDAVHKDAASIATNLCAITSAFVALAAEEDVAAPPAPESSAVRPSVDEASSNGMREMRAQLLNLCSVPVRRVESALSETSLALNKIAATFMRVAGCIDLDSVKSDVGYDPRSDIQAFPRVLTEATAALQSSDGELAHVQSHQRLLATLLSAHVDTRAIAQAVADTGELGPLGSFLEERVHSTQRS